MDTSQGETRSSGRRAHFAAFAAVLLFAGCVETTGSSLQSGSTEDSGGETTRASVSARSGGGYSLVLNRDGVVCTAAFEDAATAGGTELARMNCSGGNDGTATIVYASDATPDRVVFAVNGEGGGSVDL